MQHSRWPTDSESGAAPWRTRADPLAAFSRLWPVLMTARAALALAMFVSAVALWLVGGANPLVVAACGAYAAQAVYARWFSQAPESRSALDTQWPRTIGLDVIVYASLQAMQFAGLNFAPLFTLPVLTAAIFGTGLLPLATAAGVSLLLLSEAWWTATGLGFDMTARMLQAGLYGIGFFGLSVLANTMALRLAAEEALARASDALAKMQVQVNQLVIDGLDDGVLVVDANGVVRSINPAAQLMLPASSTGQRQVPFVLAGDQACLQLADLVTSSMQSGEKTLALAVTGAGGTLLQLVAQTRLVRIDAGSQATVCVVYLEDSRAIEARVRTAKLAAMGRMSAAVAHEIRNPLAAIAQANGLLAESVASPHDQRLTRIVQDNARRLGRIVDDVLSVSHVQSEPSRALVHLQLRSTLNAICADWANLTNNSARLQMADIAAVTVRFEPDHLRQVVVNLLDNAARFASQAPDSIRVSGAIDDSSNRVQLQVWSDGAPIDSGVQVHLFEPFFSSESRSSGLGLFISRELCERHGATITYSRSSNGVELGNRFEVSCELLANVLEARSPVFSAKMPTQSVL